MCSLIKILSYVSFNVHVNRIDSRNVQFVSSYLEDLEPGRISDENSLRDDEGNVINTNSKFRLKKLGQFLMCSEKSLMTEMGQIPLASALISGIVTTAPRNTFECYEHDH
jgi:hypothetical protein